MSILIQYIANYAPWLYFICGAIALYQLYRAWLVRAERRQAVFSLEREKAVRDLGNIFSTALLLLLVMGITYFTSTTLVKAFAQQIQDAASPSPEMPAGLGQNSTPTPTDTPLDALATLGTPEATTRAPLLQPTTPVTETAEAVQDGQATVDVQATAATPTPVPPTAAPAPIVQSPSCPDPRSAILRPGMNETVSGNVSLVGTATHENFQYYKVEYAPAGSNNFVYLAGDKNPVVNGFLVSINTSALGPGAWTLRLVVVDQVGNYPEPCQVTILIEN